MFRQSLNQTQLTITLKPVGPLLIKSGQEGGADPTLLDMNFVRTHRPGFGKPTVFIPGSSLKGTLRSYTERILRTVLGEGGDRCCNPFDTDEHSKTRFCGKLLEEEKDTPSRYRKSCPACRIFGNTALAGRLSVTDAYPPDQEAWEAANQVEQRDGVAIDRILGGTVPGALFTFEVVTQGAFHTTLTLENLELWQLGLLAITLRDLGSGLCPIGFGKTRGLGRMEVTLDRLEVGYPGHFGVQVDGRDYATTLYGVGVLKPDWRGGKSYGLADEAAIALKDLSPSLVEDGSLGRVAFALAGNEAVRQALRRTAKAWKSYAEAKRAEGGTG